MPKIFTKFFRNFKNFKESLRTQGTSRFEIFKDSKFLHASSDFQESEKSNADKNPMNMMNPTNL